MPLPRPFAPPVGRASDGRRQAKPAAPGNANAIKRRLLPVGEAGVGKTSIVEALAQSLSLTSSLKTCAAAAV